MGYYTSGTASSSVSGTIYLNGGNQRITLFAEITAVAAFGLLQAQLSGVSESGISPLVKQSSTITLLSKNTLSWEQLFWVDASNPPTYDFNLISVVGSPAFKWYIYNESP